MTIERDAPPATATDSAEEIVRFVFGAEFAGSLLQGARAMLAAAPDELAESFEQAVLASGLAA